MKRILFTFSLLALMLTGYTSLQAQSPASLAAASPATSGMTVFDAYRMNFAAAVNLGNVQMADPHRVKLVSHMDREIAKADAAASTASAPRDAAAKVTRARAIADTFRNMDLSTVAALEVAKTKLNLVDEFGILTAQKTADTH